MLLKNQLFFSDDPINLLRPSLYIYLILISISIIVQMLRFRCSAAANGGIDTVGIPVLSESY
jgi:hypothetical protein